MNLFGAPTVEFCEKAGTGLIKRPFYALGNIVYLIVGLIILRKNTRFSRHFGYTAVFIGLASFFYDASYTYISQLVDLLGMFLFVNLIINLSARRYFLYSVKKLLLIQVILMGLGMVIVISFKSFTGGYVFGVFILMEVILEIFLWRKGKAHDFKLWLWGLGFFVLGFAAWLPDAVFKICDPTDILNGRSVFHFLTAITVYLLYKYFEKQN